MLALRLGNETLSAITLTVTCSNGGKSRTRHPITIAPDWTVDAPHDMELERIAAGLGSKLSCVTLVDRIIPAAHDLWTAEHRLCARFPERTVDARRSKDHERPG